MKMLLNAKKAVEAEADVDQGEEQQQAEAVREGALHPEVAGQGALPVAVANQAMNILKDSFLLSSVLCGRYSYCPVF